MGPVLQAVDKNQLKFLALKTKRVLMECSVISQMLFKDFAKHFIKMFGENIELETLERELTDTVTVSTRFSWIYLVKVKIVPI